jgi:epoxyqueuosine reductase
MTRTRSPRPPDRRSPESLIEQTALDVGFSLAGIADVSPSPLAGAAFERWIDAGMNGEMGYLSKGADKRKDLALLLDGARSVVCVGVDYYSAKKEDWNRDAPSDGRGRVALYAHGRDYHIVLRRMLGELEERLRSIFPGMRACAAVDTEPISERDLAIRAGIGWLGKNTCVISPAYGSWIFLGELITDLELHPDTPLETVCGGCTRCIDSCPTGALEPFALDARQCISYLTIEKRGDIPAGFHPAMGDRLFGCDECQKACPFNDRAKESVVFGGDDRNAVVGLTIGELTGISDHRFRELVRGTVMGRCGPARIRRNARIVAKNRVPPV